MSNWYKGRVLEGVVEGLLRDASYVVHKTGWEYRFPDLLKQHAVIPRVVRSLPDLLIEHRQLGAVWAEVRYRQKWSCYSLHEEIVRTASNFPDDSKLVVIHGFSFGIQSPEAGLFVVPHWVEKERSQTFKNFFPGVSEEMIVKTLAFLKTLETMPEDDAFVPAPMLDDDLPF